MLLEPDDRKLFFTLYPALMSFVNQRLNVAPGTPSKPGNFGSMTTELRIQIRDAWLANAELIDAFCEENRERFSGDELEIVRSWRLFVADSFYIFREMAKHTVFLSRSTPMLAYGVLALSQPFEEIAGTLPLMVDAVLLPFKGRIVCDGLMKLSPVSLGPGMRASLNEDFKETKAQRGIVTSLPASEAPPKRLKTKPVSKPLAQGKKDYVLQTVTELVDGFCKAHLNEEYAALCRKMAGKLGRKRPSPFLHGGANAWASGIIRAVGGVNFLHDKSQTPHMRLADIDHHLGTSPSNGAARAVEIRKLLKMTPFNFTWNLQSNLDRNPMLWFLKVNGFMMDIRDAPREAQEIAFNKGLIPYIPADRQRHK